MIFADPEILLTGFYCTFRQLQRLIICREGQVNTYVKISSEELFAPT